jgi:tRNA nucleotidyltransferase (CCA-adding enzyme)
VLSPERVREELLKVLGQDPAPARSLELYAESGALAVLYPELDAVRSEGGWARSLATIERLPPARPLTRLAALLRPLQEERAAALLVRMRLSNAVTDEVARLASASPLPGTQAPDADFRRWLMRYGASRLGRVARIELAEAAGGSRGPAPTEVVESWRRARAVLRTSPPLAVSDLAIDGRDLMRLGLRPGPGFGLILEGLLDWVLEDPSRNETSGLGARAIELATIIAEDGGREDSGDD